MREGLREMLTVLILRKFIVITNKQMLTVNLVVKDGSIWFKGLWL